MKTEEKQVLYTSDEAATYRTNISGWVSRKGQFCGEGKHGEDAARYIGCTHVKCEKCGTVHTKTSACEICRDHRMTEIYEAAPRKKWDGSTPIVIQDSDFFFFDVESLKDWCFEHQCQPDDLRLMHCIGSSPRLLSSEHFCDDLSEDQELPIELQDAIDVFNEAVMSYGKPLSWREGNEAVEKPTGIVVEFEREDEAP